MDVCRVRGEKSRHPPFRSPFPDATANAVPGTIPADSGAIPGAAG
jgi:hypothetical protein